jgi:DtxR family Mn-dependent transcriptional regulator
MNSAVTPVIAYPDPLLALLTFAGLAVLVALIWWPRLGLYWRWRQAGRGAERVLLEDGLKHLYTCETAGHRCTTESLAGILGVSRGRAIEVVNRLEETALAGHDGEGLSLTPAGRSYALRIVRTHRLWERYLADRTGVIPGEWHAAAEDAEHALSEAEVEGLASRMGHPLYDPHGDPIPTADGELPPARGVALPSLAVGETAAVVHIEDEPEEVFRVLHAGGLRVGSRIRLDVNEADAVHLQVEGRELRLSPAAARNLTVERTPSAEHDGDVERLDALRPGESAEVIRLAATVQGPSRRRLLDLGVVPGTVIRADLPSASGDPMAYRIRGALIALRRVQAHEILVRRVAAGVAA